MSSCNRANQLTVDAIHGAILAGITPLADNLPDLGVMSSQVTVLLPLSPLYVLISSSQLNNKDLKYNACTLLF
jgi:hypothetical protein